MGLQIQWKIIFVTQKRCLLEPERASCLVQRTVSCPTGAPGVAAHWWDNLLLCLWTKFSLLYLHHLCITSFYFLTKHFFLYQSKALVLWPLFKQCAMTDQLEALTSSNFFIPPQHSFFSRLDLYECKVMPYGIASALCALSCRACTGQIGEDRHRVKHLLGCSAFIA